MKTLLLFHHFLEKMISVQWMTPLLCSMLVWWLTQGDLFWDADNIALSMFAYVSLGLIARSLFLVIQWTFSSVSERCDDACLVKQWVFMHPCMSQVILSSAFIPLFSGWLPPKYRGVRYMDGCYSDNLPILDEHTITVSPFCGESDICPRDPTANLMQVWNNCWLFDKCFVWNGVCAALLGIVFF